MRVGDSKDATSSVQQPAVRVERFLVPLVPPHAHVSTNRRMPRPNLLRPSVPESTFPAQWSDSGHVGLTLVTRV